MFRQVGVYAGSILKGRAELPVSNKFHLVINLTTAKSARPHGMMSIADEVIE